MNYDEVKSGRTSTTAIGFTAAETSTRFLWPARHEAGSTADVNIRRWARASGSRRASRTEVALREGLPGCVKAMKPTGVLILADNGSSWFFQGTADKRWTYTMVDQLKAIPAAGFQAVDESCLMVGRNSGQARSGEPPHTSGSATAALNLDLPQALNR